MSYAFDGLGREREQCRLVPADESRQNPTIFVRKVRQLVREEIAYEGYGSTPLSDVTYVHRRYAFP
jgi:hypothetical protein